METIFKITSNDSDSILCVSLFTEVEPNEICDLKLSPDADIAIIRCGGYACIIPAGRTDMDMGSVCALIRLQEMSPNVRQYAQFAECLELGVHNHVPEWSADACGRLFNGLDGREVPATKLSNDQLIDIIRIVYRGQTEEVFNKLVRSRSQNKIVPMPAPKDDGRTQQRKKVGTRRCKVIPKVNRREALRAHNMPLGVEALFAC